MEDDLKKNNANAAVGAPWVLNGKAIDSPHRLFVYLNQSLKKSPALQNAASPSQTSTSTPDQKQASLFDGGLRAGSVRLLRSVVKSYSEAALPLFAASILIDVLSVGLTWLNIYPLFLSRRQIRVELHLFFPLREERGKCLDGRFNQ